MRRFPRPFLAGQWHGAQKRARDSWGRPQEPDIQACQQPHGPWPAYPAGRTSKPYRRAPDPQAKSLIAGGAGRRTRSSSYTVRPAFTIAAMSSAASKMSAARWSS